MFEAVQSTYCSAAATAMGTSPPQQDQNALIPPITTPLTKAIESNFTIGEYTLRGEENDIVAKHVMRCIVLDIIKEVEDLRQRMDKIWASKSQLQTHFSRQWSDAHQRIEQRIDDLLARAWAAVGRSKLGL